MNVKMQCKRCGLKAEIEGSNLTGDNFLTLLMALGWKIDNQETVCPICKQKDEMQYMNLMRNGWDGDA